MNKWFYQKNVKWTNLFHLFFLFLIEAPKFPASSKAKGGKPAPEFEPPGVNSLREKLTQNEQKQECLRKFILRNNDGSFYNFHWMKFFAWIFC